MTNEPRQALRELIAKYGTEICSDGKRCEGLLRDKCGSFRREISVLINALEEHVPLDLLAGRNSVPRDLLLNRLVKRLEDHLALTEDAALWAVESWALALNVLSDREIAEREIKRKKLRPESAIEENDKNFPPAPPTQRQPTPKKPTNQPPVFAPAPPKPKQSTIPIDSQINAPTPAQHPVPAGKTLPQSNQTQTPTPQMQPKKRSRKIVGCFVGCFLLLILLGLLIVGVPYSFKVMRETQQSQPQRAPQQ